MTITKNTVWNTTTQSTYELAIDHDLLGNAGFDTVQPWRAIGDNTQLFALDADDIEWWEEHPEGIEEEASREWASVGDLGELQDGCGNSLVRDEFGRGTWGLYTEIDGHSACLRCWSVEDANETLDKLADGWRPTNWQA